METVQQLLEADEPQVILGALSRLMHLEETRHRQRVAEIQRVCDYVQSVAAQTGQTGVDIESAVLTLRIGNAKLLSEMVLKAAKQFGEASFSLDTVCKVLERAHPGLVLDRTSVSRRLYELRISQPPKIETVVLGDGLTSKQKRYRYIGPP